MLSCVNKANGKPHSEWSKTAVVISSELKHLTGRGEEWLMDQAGNVLLKFYNGSIVTILLDKTGCNNDPTIGVAG